MSFSWAVIGAGPAGIASVGRLLDHGEKPEEIAWIDPAFSVGDFGSLWQLVPSNTRVEAFLTFLHHCKAFDYANSPEDFEINHKVISEHCDLKDVAKPLQWISNHLKGKVTAIQDVCENLHRVDRIWQITLKKSQLTAKKVILAIGAEPKQLNYSAPPVVSLREALNPHKLKTYGAADFTWAVFGSSHSAILVLRNLIEQGVKKIINFYRSPLLYAIEMDGWILFDNDGLKGTAATWALEHLDGTKLKNVERIFSNEENIAEYLPQCDKVIYAIGFERRTLPTVTGLGHLNYIPQTGIIAPGLFGVGIAFPEAKLNPIGILEHRVGLRKFMDYLQRMVPIWMRYPEP